MAVSIAFLAQEKRSILLFWEQFKKLTPLLKFALSVLVITASYFGGAMYFVAASTSTLSTPASCDNVIEFDVPSSLPESDSELFIESFERFNFFPLEKPVEVLNISSNL